ncbi:MAG: stage II sporulation protein SpoIID, partial [Clostridia bacterium]|nr:stage II sporulation protein SpoIID [Clostridia bacterium]
VYGHGVGMSQWGARALAEEGKKAEEIIRYFFQGVQIEKRWR